MMLQPGLLAHGDGGLRAFARAAMEHQHALAVIGQGLRVESGKRIEEGAVDTLGGEFRRFAHIHQEDAAAFQAGLDLGGCHVEDGLHGNLLIRHNIFAIANIRRC